VQGWALHVDPRREGPRGGGRPWGGGLPQGGGPPREVRCRQEEAACGEAGGARRRASVGARVLARASPREAGAARRRAVIGRRAPARWSSAADGRRSRGDVAARPGRDVDARRKEGTVVERRLAQRGSMRRCAAAAAWRWLRRRRLAAAANARAKIRQPNEVPSMRNGKIG
jgi:hypothetical protein